MDFIVKDRDVLPIAVVDLYSEAIWAERYCSTGDFKLYLPLNSQYLDYLAIGNYLTISDSDRAMIIESMLITSKIDAGEKLAVYEGRSLESILYRRIILGPVTYNASAEYIISKLIEDNATNPSNIARKIDKLVYMGPIDNRTRQYLESLDDIECQFNGEYLFDAVKAICEQINLGFKIIFDSVGRFAFYLYYGTDRTSAQTDRDAVVFSPEFDTLISSRFLVKNTEYRNVAIVDGEIKEDVPRKRVQSYYGNAEPSGLDRREKYVDANNLKQSDDEVELTDAEYEQVLQYKGFEELHKNQTTAVFDGEAETNIGPQYNREYFLGDFVSLKNEFNLGASAQITEYIRSYDAKGYSAYPTIVIIE